MQFDLTSPQRTLQARARDLACGPGTAHAAEIDRSRGQGREEAMREYLVWEIDLVNQMATDDDHRFRVVTV